MLHVATIQHFEGIAIVPLSVARTSSSTAKGSLEEEKETVLDHMPHIPAVFILLTGRS